MMKRAILLLAAAILISSGCTNYSNINVKRVSLNGFKLRNTSSADVTFDYMVDNPGSSALIIHSADGVIKKKGINFAQLALNEPDTIPSKAHKNSSLVIKIDLLDPISLLSMGLNIGSWRAEDFELDARIIIKNGNGRKKVIRLKDVPLESLINRL